MKKELYITPTLKMLMVDQENLMDFGVSGSEPGDDFEYAKDNDLNGNDSWSSGGSVWED